MCASQVALRRAEMARLTGNYTSALTFAGAGRQCCLGGGRSGQRGQGLRHRGRILLNQGQYQEAPDWLEMAAALGERTGNPAIVAQATYDLGNAAYFGGNMRWRWITSRAALDSYRKLGDARGQVNVLLMIGTVRGYRGDHTGAHQSLTEALTLCRSIGWRHGETYILGNLGTALLDLGDFQAARNYHQQALTICREVQDRVKRGSQSTWRRRAGIFASG